LALTEAVGPIKTTNEVGVDLKMVPLFIAGFVEGMTGNLELGELDTCMTSTMTLEPMVMKILSDLKHKKLLKAGLDLQKFIFHLQKDLAPCKDMDEDIKTIESWASIMLDPEAFGETMTYNYIENR